VQTSSTAAQYSFPSAVGCSVMSVTHNRFGAVATNSRLTRFARHSPGDRWFVVERYVKVNGVWRYVYRAVDQQARPGHRRADSPRRDAKAAPVLRPGLRTFNVTPCEVLTDAAPVYPGLLEELTLPRAASFGPKPRR
jgi:transposase-like protein